METVVDLSEVSLVRGGTRILNSVSWTTRVGEHWVVLGPNGAGKTSLARIVAGREVPSSGEASVLGERIGTTDPRELATRVGFSSQSVAQRIPGSSTVSSVVLTASWGQSLSFHESYEDEDTARAEDLIALFGVAALADRRFSTLSEGERQRVLLARALMADPEVLVLDEPTAGLDLGARELLVGALEELTADPASPQLILVTHQIEEIAPGFTHAAVMAEGRILAAGPIEETLTGVTLSRAFRLPLRAGRTEGRWWAHAPGREARGTGSRAGATQASASVGMIPGLPGTH